MQNNSQMNSGNCKTFLFLFLITNIDSNSSGMMSNQSNINDQNQPMITD